MRSFSICWCDVGVYDDLCTSHVMFWWCLYRRTSGLVCIIFHIQTEHQLILKSHNCDERVENFSFISFTKYMVHRTKNVIGKKLGNFCFGAFPSNDLGASWNWCTIMQCFRSKIWGWISFLRLTLELRFHKSMNPSKIMSKAFCWQFSSFTANVFHIETLPNNPFR